MTPTTGRSRWGTGRSAFRPRPAAATAGSLLVGFLLAFTPIASPARGLEGSLDPSPSVAPSASTDPTPSPPPAATPDPTAPPDPSAAPTPSTTSIPAPTDSPIPSTEPTPVADQTPGAEPSAAPTANPAPDPTPPPAALGADLYVDHAWIDVVDATTGAPIPGALDRAATGVDRVRVFVVRFRVVNPGSEAALLEPLLQFGPGASPSFWDAVPAVRALDGRPFYAASRGGAAAGGTVAPIPVSEMRLLTSPLPDGSAVPGTAQAGVNPGPGLVLPGGSFTEVSFAVHATDDAAWLASYGLRLANDAGPIGGDRFAVLTMRDSGLVAPLVQLGPSPYTSPHTNLSLIADACGACHRAHTGSSTMLLGRAAPQAALCFSCHDGNGSLLEVKAAFDAAPANDPDTSSWYTHPATTDLTHLAGQLDEFGERLNRHSTCTDCHQPHRADGTLAVTGPDGWSASGAIIGASGVSVSYGAGPPVYSLLEAVDLEYQLCLKCHSGFTELPEPDLAHPSRWALDKGVELDPANGSYHPIAAPGTNQTAAMLESLAGGTLWQFSPGDTIRCTNCHGDPLKALPGATTLPGDRLAPHASGERGILIAAYRDRLLKPAGEAYAETDFTLCFLCHSSEPFTSEASTATNFRLHAEHAAGVTSSDGIASSDIDLAGAGVGNAICAECHFRLHSTAYAFALVDVGNERLVSFAPNVLPLNGVLSWTGPDGTCTLVCHGVNHSAEPY